MNQENFNNWYALYTKSRHEKFVESQLLERGIPAFTPKVILRRKWSDRIKSIEEPLFKSYCFAKFSIQSRIEVASQEGIATIVHFNNHYVPVEESVINSLKILTENKFKLDPCPYLKVGDKVTIKRGALKGLEGFITEKRNGNTTLVVSVDAIFSSVKCIIDTSYVDPC
jgi:transcription antitermination factor NusG